MRRRSDLELVATFRAGEDDAFSEVVRRYGDPLLRYARQSLRGSAQDPEDVVQEALARAFTALRRDDRPMVLRPWLYCIVRNCVMDSLRAPLHATLDEDLPTRGATTAIDEVLARCDLAALMEAVAALPERQRRALVLRTFEGRTYQAIAAELDTSVSATKALIARARAGVRPAPLAEAA